MTEEEETLTEIRAEIGKLSKAEQAKIEIVARIIRLTLCVNSDVGAMSLALVGAEIAAGVTPPGPM